MLVLQTFPKSLAPGIWVVVFYSVWGEPPKISWT